MRALLHTNPLPAIAAAALLLTWPAALNHYPILFSDTGGLLDMGLLPSMGWDKPFVYGPFLAALSLHLTLWLPLLAQNLLLSYALWRVQPLTRPLHFLARAALLAAVTTAPWFASTLMPDAFTPIVVLTLLAPRPGPATILLAAIAIAAHLSHLVLAAALLAALALLHRRIPWRPLASLAAAILFLLASNWIGHGRLAISPYGSVFALARLIADGPARDYLDHTCPDAGWLLCPWRDRLTDDSDQFLWDANSPFWADPTPLPAFAAQASQIVLGTIRTEPLSVLRDAYRNTAHQLVRTSLGDTLTAEHLADSVRPRIERFYPRQELERFDASRQAHDSLLPVAAALHSLDDLVLFGALAGSTALLIAALASARKVAAAAAGDVPDRLPRRPTPRADLAALILIALAANAFATGALSNVHDRYQARLAWLLVLPLLPFSPAPRSRNPPPKPP